MSVSNYLYSLHNSPVRLSSSSQWKPEIMVNKCSGYTDPMEAEAVNCKKLTLSRATTWTKVWCVVILQ